MVSMRLDEIGTIACFQDRPLVVGWTFSPLLFYLGNAASWISRIFLFGKAENVSLILRIVEAFVVA